MTEKRSEGLVQRRRPHGVLMVLAMISASSCITGTRRGYPLYPNPPLLDEHGVAFLTGYVHDVDGKDVSANGQSFDLLPGCHIVGTPSKGGMMNSQAGVVFATGSHRFAIPMKAAHSYVIEVGASAQFNALAGPGLLLGREIDEAGHTSRTFAPASSVEDFRNCEKEGQP